MDIRNHLPFSSIQFDISLAGTNTYTKSWRSAPIEVSPNKLAKFTKLNNEQQQFTQEEIDSAGYSRIDVLNDIPNVSIGELLDWLAEYVGVENYITDRGCSVAWFLHEEDRTYFLLRWMK